MPPLAGPASDGARQHAMDRSACVTIERDAANLTHWGGRALRRAAEDCTLAATMGERTTPRQARSAASEAARRAADDAARVAAFRELARRLRTEAGLTQGELAERMGTTQSAIARLEAGGVRPTLETLERLAHALGHDLVVGVGPELGDHRSIAKLERDGHGVVRRAR